MASSASFSRTRGSVAGARPCSPAEAVQRALSLVGKGGRYVLGTGDYLGDDKPPWTTRDGLSGSDCAGFAISWCYKLPRHRKGYNVGSWASVSDDLNCNSAIEDAEHARELFVPADRPQPGDLVTYPTFTLLASDGTHKTFIGHVGIVTGVSRVLEWDPETPQYELLDIAQCKGPNGRAPAVVATDGSVWAHHDTVWPKPQHRTRVLRVRP